MSGEPTCPSATGDTAEARIIGFINPNGQVAHIAPPVAFTDAMRHSVGPMPERVFRLAGRCLGGGCSQWAEGACGLIGKLRAKIEAVPDSARADGALPRCGIRTECVWWGQDGPAACRVCSFVTYNPSKAE